MVVAWLKRGSFLLRSNSRRGVLRCDRMRAKTQAIGWSAHSSPRPDTMWVDAPMFFLVGLCGCNDAPAQTQCPGRSTVELVR